MQRVFASAHRTRRRGAVAVQTAIVAVLLVGFVALSVDVGFLYNVRGELQNTADAAALAAARELGDYSSGDPMPQARLAAAEFAVLNKVNGESVGLAATDVEFGRAHLDDATGKYVFVPTEAFPNAVRVRARRTDNSPSGPVPLYFARIFGANEANVGTKAAAVLTPRDIVLAFDLSTSLNDDSSLRSYKKIEIYNRRVWESLWDRKLDEEVPIGADDLPEGPKLGNMNVWGDEVTGPGWDFDNDPGLTDLTRNDDWNLTADWTSQTLTASGHGSYNAAEMAAINSDANDGDSAHYRRRVLVALGIYRWKSGQSGGQPGGNGNNYIGASEVEPMVPYPSGETNPDTTHKQVGGTWESFVDYVRSSDSSMSRYDPDNQLYGDKDLRYEFGLKTWVDYLQERKYGDATSPGLAGTLQQPWAATSDGFKESLKIISDLQSSDLVGMASYATVGYGPLEKPDNMSWLTDDYDSVSSLIDRLQPGMWTTNTNIAQGIDKCVEVLFDSPAARRNSAKVILLFTDGMANRTRHGAHYDLEQARRDAKQAAYDARKLGVQIYTVSLGVSADKGLMGAIATIGEGEHYHAEGGIVTYQDQLEKIFRKLGGKRPVVLIE